MDKDIPLPAIIGIAVVILGLIVLGLVRVMAPHEKVISNPGETRQFAAARMRAAGQGQ